MKNFKAFTLIEILLALSVVGAIAALTAPKLMNHINNRVATNQLKNIISDISFYIDEELLNNNTKNITNTGLKDRTSVLSHFESDLACSDDNPCWAASYKKISDMSDAEITIPDNAASIKLKNGASLSYTFSNGTLLDKFKDPEVVGPKEPLPNRPWTQGLSLRPVFAATSTFEKNPGFEMEANKQDVLQTDQLKDLLLTNGIFTIDLNGPAAPNVIGRDLFIITITYKGNIQSSSSSLDTLKTQCHSGTAASCVSYLLANNWNMDY